MAVEPESQIIVGATVLLGNALDATQLREQVEQVEANTGQPVAESLEDCAYGSGETRQEFARAGRTLLAKVSPQRVPGVPTVGCFPRRGL